MKSKRLLTLLLATLVPSGRLSAGQSNLNAGDLVFLAANSDTPDTFAFAPLVNLEAGTVIHFTDNSRTGTGTGFADWRKNANGSFSEAPYFTWVAPVATVAGTKITIPDTVHGGMGLATGGDNLFAFQGDLYNPRFITAVGWTSAAPFITTGSATANNSYVPVTLTLGASAVEIAANVDNAGYNSITEGTAAALRNAVNTASNWITNETVVQAGPAGLTITDAADAPAATKQLAGYGFGLASASYSESATVIAAHTTFSSFGFAGTGTRDDNGSNALVGQAFQVAGGWSTGSITEASQYMGFTLTVDPGYSFELADLGYAYQSSENMLLAGYFSTDGFATSSPLGPGIALTDTNVGATSLTQLGIGGLTGSVEFRFYGYNAATGVGALEIDEVWIQGSSVQVPESGPALLGGIGLLCLLRRRR
jgi:hypothetical protein